MRAISLLATLALAASLSAAPMQASPVAAAEPASPSAAPRPVAAPGVPEPIKPSASPDPRHAEVVHGLRADGSFGTLVTQVAERFIGWPYLANPLTVGMPQAGVPESLVSRLDGFDCVTLVESSLAIARTVAQGKPTPEAFRHELETLRYRDGRRGDFSTRLNYFSEWIADNARRGTVVEITPELGGAPVTRAMTFMTTHRQAYPALADPGIFAALKGVEASLSARPQSVIPMHRAPSVVDQLQPGDILAFTTSIPGLDVVHTGLVARGPGGALHLLHAPQPGEPVTISSKPLVEYFRTSRRHKGIMVARPIALADSPRALP